ncbi:MAG: hypothetical protein IPK82_29270 [Polyangiaceae bacterium]|nr:hypothetical protein [Polyangiaceae bacterium]
MNHLRKVFLLITLLLGVFATGTLVGCSTEIVAPTAVATSDPPTVAVGGVVLLDGSTSSDPQDLPLYFRWSMVDLPAGSSTELVAPETAKPYFLADVAGTYTVGLIVSNGTTTSEKVTVAITAGPCGTYSPVVESIAANPMGPAQGQPVSLSAVVSHPDSAPPCELGRVLTHGWKLSAVPPGSNAALSSTTNETPFFVPDLPGDYTVTLVATDELGRESAPNSLTITASNCTGNAPVIDSITPSSANPVVGQSVQIASTVSDADAMAPCNVPQSFIYEWNIVGQPSGSLATLNNPGADAPSFVPDVEGDYTIALVVTDLSGLSSMPVTTVVTASTCGSAFPSAVIQELFPDLAGPGQSVIGPNIGVNDVVQLDASLSTDADNAAPCNLGQPLTYWWHFLALPAGSDAAINNATVVNPSFFTDRAGTYVVGLIVTDSSGNQSSEATFTIQADPSVGIGVPAGFTIQTVATWPQIDQPRGLTKDGAGSIYVVQGNSHLNRIAADGSVVQISTGGFMNSPNDVVFEPGANQLLVTAGAGQIIKVDLAGVQTICVDNGAATFRGIDLYNGTGGLRFITADIFGNRAAYYDPATCTLSSTNDFGGNMNNPWGVTAALLGGVDTSFVTDSSNDDIRRNTGGAYSNNGGSSTVISNHFVIGSPRDIVVTPCAMPKLIVANRDGANLLLVTNTPNPNVPSVISNGFLAPVGLYFEDQNNLLVTDEVLDAVFRVTGPFCTL